MINAKYVDGLELRIRELNKKLSNEADEALHLIAENNSLKAERDALAAQAEALRGIAYLADCAIVENSEGNFGEERKWLDKLYQAADEYDCTKTPQQHLAEIRAQAVSSCADKLGDAFILPHNLRKETQKAEFYKAGWRDAFLFIKQYAASIRQEKQ